MLKNKDGFCAPLALKYLSGATPSAVHVACCSNGFSEDAGQEEFEFLKSAKELGIRLRRVNLKREGMYRAKLKDFIAKHPKGAFLIYTDRHLFVVDYSKVIDPLTEGEGHDRLVTGAWYVLQGSEV